MPLYKIPLTAVNQIFDIHLGGVHYQIELRWNAEMPAWVIDVADANTGEALVLGIPLVTGCDLLGPYGYLGFQGALVAISDGSLEAPDYGSLGTESNLYFIADVEGFIREAERGALDG